MFKKILAVVLVFSFAFAFAACGKDDEVTAGTTATDAYADLFAEGKTTEPITEVEVVTNAAGEVVTAAGGEVVTEAVVVTEPPMTNAAGEIIVMPETTEEIVAYFNDAVNGVKTNATSVKRNYSKISLNGTPVLPGVVDGILKLLGGADKFLGDQLAKNSKGEETYTGADIKAVFPVETESYASKLTASDVESAKIAKDGDGNFVIRVVTKKDDKSSTVQHGQGHAPKAFNVVLPGVVNDALGSIPGAKGIVGEASMNYPSSTATIVVDPMTGNVIKATYDLKWTINFDKAGVVIGFTTLDEFVISY